MLAGREVSQAGIDGQTWQNEHLVYTHGYGAVAAKVNTANTEGAPVLVLADVPTRAIGDAPELTQPRIYFGEGDPTDAPFVIVGSKTDELDYQGASYRYESDARRHRDRQRAAASPVRLAVPRREPADLGPGRVARAAS